MYNALTGLLALNFIIFSAKEDIKLFLSSLQEFDINFK